MIGIYCSCTADFLMNTVFDQPANLDYVLKGLLTHTLLPEGEIRNVLRDYRWNGTDTYFCMVMQFKLNENCSYALNPIASKLSEKLKQNCYSIVGNNIVYVINLTVLKMARQEAWESITVFLILLQISFRLLEKAEEKTIVK